MLKSLGFLIALVFVSGFSSAAVNAPNAVEALYSYETEFVTADKRTANEVVESHARFLFGYLQNAGQVKAFDLPEQLEGIGAPLWPPQVMQVLSDDSSARLRHLRYRMSGRVLLHSKAAADLIVRKSWNITLPYDLDHFFIKACAQWDNNTVE